MDSNKNNEDTGKIKESDSGCGPGCDCGKPAGNNRIKTVVVLLVVLAVCGIFIYKSKTSESKQTSVESSASGFNTPATNEKATKAPGAVQDTVGSAVAVVNEKKVPEVKKTDTGTAAPEKNISKTEVVSATPPVETQKPVAKTDEENKPIGDYLDSMSSLNKVAVSQDAVFIFIPAKADQAVKKEISDAVMTAQKTLKAKGVNVGLYTLKTASPEYAGIAKQVELPGIIVATKGRGMGAVSGEITEAKLLQAYVASSRAAAGGGCGPASGGCGPTSAGCN